MEKENRTPATKYGEQTKLKELIVKKYGTQKEFAKAIGMNAATLSRCLNGLLEWRGSDLLAAIKALKIPYKDVNLYFFVPKVAKSPRVAK